MTFCQALDCYCICLPVFLSVCAAAYPVRVPGYRGYPGTGYCGCVAAAVSVVGSPYVEYYPPHHSVESVELYPPHHSVESVELYCVCLSVCLFVCLSVCVFVCLFVCLFEALKTFKFTGYPGTGYCGCVAATVSVVGSPYVEYSPHHSVESLNTYCSTNASVCLFVCLSVCLFVCLSVCLSVCLFV